MIVTALEEERLLKSKHAVDWKTNTHSCFTCSVGTGEGQGPGLAALDC